MSVQLTLFPHFPTLKPPIFPKLEAEEDIEYPSSDGKPMSENILHFDILNYLKNSLDSLLAKDANALVAGDLMVYYEKGNVHKRIAPDVMVALGRDKGNRGSYIIHKEAHIPPTTTFEIVSPSNLKAKPDLSNRWLKYAHMKVKEYFVIHAVEQKGFYIESFKEINGYLVPMLNFGKHTSERLKIEISFEEDIFTVRDLEGNVLNRYVTEVDLRKQAEEGKKQAEEKAHKAEEEKRKAQEENELLKADLKRQMQELAELRQLVNAELGKETS